MYANALIYVIFLAKRRPTTLLKVVFMNYLVHKYVAKNIPN